MKTIVIANQKGGIGKTTSATNIAAILEKRGKHTLLIDTDVQGNSSDTYDAKIEGAATLYDVLLDEDKIPITDAIQHTQCGDIVASDPLLRRADEILRPDSEGLYRLQDALRILNGYEYVLIDTGPAINSILQNCLVCADSIIIPVTADRYGLLGLSQLKETIDAIKRRQNKNLKIEGILLVKFNSRTRLAQEVQDDLSRIAVNMGTKVFKTAIRESTKAKEAQAMNKTLIDYAPDCTTALDYSAVVAEILGEV